MSRLSPAIFNFLVICLSASLAIKTPDGWLCELCEALHNWHYVNKNIMQTKIFKSLIH